jgi:uncharacterized protein
LHVSDSLPVYAVRVHVFVRQGREDDFRAELTSINAACAQITDFLGLGTDVESGSSHSTHWLLSYRFVSREGRDACQALVLRSLQRMSEMMTSPPVVDLDSHRDQRRAAEVVTARVPTDKSGEYVGLRQEMNALVAAAPGFVSVETHPPTEEDDTWVTTITFDTQADLESWVNSSERERLVSKLQSLAPDEVRTLPTGFGQWFAVNAVGMVQAPAWKQAMTVVAVLFAMTSVLNIFLGDFVGQGWTIRGDRVFSGLGLPMPVVVFIGSVVGTCLLTWVLMPIATRLLAWWLDPGVTRSRTILGVIVLIVVYGIEIAFFTTVFRTLGI